MENWEYFNLNAVLSSVIDSGVLFKDSGLWQYYFNDTDFDNNIEAVTQKHNEDFEQFIKRVVLYLFKRDEMSDELLTQINYAIYCNMSSQKDIEESVHLIKDFTNGYLQCIEDLCNWNGGVENPCHLDLHNKLIVLEESLIKRAKELLK